MAYLQGNSVPKANLGVLDNLIAARHEIAQVNFNSLSIGKISIFINLYILYYNDVLWL